MFGKIGALFLFTFTACATAGLVGHNLSWAPARSQRNPSSEQPAPAPRIAEATLSALQQDAKVSGGNIGFTNSLTSNEMIDYWHLTEGSDLFPYRWFFTLRSFTSNEPGTLLADDLDRKFGIVKETPEIIKKSTYALHWIGLSASWSDTDPRIADVHRENGQTPEDIAKLMPASKAVAMIGVNCAFCHSNSMQFGDHNLFLDGAPAMVNLYGFYADLYASTAMTMLSVDRLQRFLKDNNVSGSDEDLARQAQDYVNRLQAALGLQPNEISKLVLKVGNLVDPSFIKDKTNRTIFLKMFQNREVIVRFLCELLQVTTGLKDLTPELQARMRFLGYAIGGDPDLPETTENYSSIDAFGRIANMLVRIQHPTPLTAVTSFPAIWGIQKRGQFHWNANTNSVVMRNIGQAFGLGAVVISPDASGPERYDSTVNIHNLSHLENIVYKIGFPDWADTNEPVDLSKAKNGCVTYYHTCAGCHDGAHERVGPQKLLIDSFIPPRGLVGTDQTYLKNQSAKVDETPFKVALFSLIGFLRDRYYENNGVTPDEQKAWEHTDLRGPELFRDTSLGEGGHSGDMSYMNTPKTSGYAARTLAGVWATAPYLHNGSVPDIYELLQPASLRPKTFFLSTRSYDPKHLGYFSDVGSNTPEIPDLEQKAKNLLNQRPGLLTRLFANSPPAPSNIYEARIQVACDAFPERCYKTDSLGNSNQGHEGTIFGTDLLDEDKINLIEFLKILRPPVEYSTNRPPLYRWDGKTCQLSP